MSNANKWHQWSIVILMMIQHIPCKQTLLCHVVVERNLYFSYATVLLHCINAVMTRVVCRPFTLINSFDHHGFSYVLFVIKIIRLLLSAFLWCMQIHVQKCWEQESDDLDNNQEVWGAMAIKWVYQYKWPTYYSYYFCIDAIHLHI